MDDSVEQFLKRYQKAKERRLSWEAYWQECYGYALPVCEGLRSESSAGSRENDFLFDGTAADAAE
ncbi:MAG: hypothetical protein FD153_918 [Rhodospirillaceae bacterium]|nr:MAG: hypothetical protein FD153_918 [Rhodospirillaceae bacterium]